ncbi:MAG: M23 family metallopeptidase [Acidobacteriota bacterium]|nr:M23 family metallopeptidase [Acidobacteriota bacterium]
MRRPFVARGLLAGALLASVSCGGENPLSRWTAKRSPHEAYTESLRASGLEGHVLGQSWIAASGSALASSQAVTLPVHEAGYFDPAKPSAVAYRFDLPRGRALDIDVTFESSRPAQLFVDLFRVNEGGSDRVAGIEAGAMTMRYVSRRGGAYMLRLQPELLAGGRYTIVQRTEASLRFPVQGAGEGNIQSIFGDARDGGRRDHHGVDIFAPRGTPVVAAADGSIRSVNTTEIGGRVIWLSDASASQSIYYAHLDDWAVTSGQRVAAGDVIGYVGNTGNARTTPPHLHFGIYSGGPVDPLPFIRASDRAPQAPLASLALLGRWARVGRAAAPLRASAGRSGAPLAVLGPDTAVEVTAASAASYRVALPDGRQGYVDARAIAPLEEAGRSVRLARGTALRESPDAQGVLIEPLPAGARVAVLAEFNGFSLVEAGGRRGWVRDGT